MWFGALGPLLVRSNRGSLVEVGPRQRRIVLARLLVDANRVVSSDRLILAVWGETPPPSAMGSMQAHVSRLRSGVGRVLQSRPSGYLLAVGRGEFDVVDFEFLVAEGREAATAGRAQEAADKFIEALEFWRGEAYEEFADLEFAREEATRLNEVRLGALEDRISAELELGRHLRLIPELESLANRYHFREGFSARLMLALYRSGRQGEALRAYQQTRKVLAEELGIEPSAEISLLEQQILLQDPALAHPDLRKLAGIGIKRRGSRRQDKRHNLPSQLTSFIGRRKDLEELRDRVRQNRLVAVVGPGGAGKTRLALEAVSGLIDEFPDGVWAVDLAPLTKSAQVVLQVASALGVDEVIDRPLNEVVAEALEGTHLLLLLDNSEHLLDPCAELTSSLLHLVPGLHILVTGRQRLGVMGEQVWPLDGLALEPIDGAESRGEAVELFIERLQGLQAGFRPSLREIALVADICSQLDGLPLAIELAAARVPGLGIRELGARLDERFRLLTGDDVTAAPRQRSLLGTVAWSHGLLSPAEAVLFRRLGMFSGSFTLQAAEAAAGDVENVVDLLPRLVGRSLVATLPDEGGDLRYRLHESLRLYAEERLKEAGEIEAVASAHAGHYAALAAFWEWRSPTAVRSGLDRLELDHANLRAALTWAIRNEQAETAICLAQRIASLWGRGYASEGLESLERSLRLEGYAPASIRANALLHAFYLCQGTDNQRAISFLEEARRCFQAAGDSRGEADALSALGQSLWDGGEWDRAVAVSQEALDLFRSTGDEVGAAECLMRMSAVAFRTAEYRRAESLGNEVLTMVRKVGDTLLEAQALYGLGILATRLGDYTQARELLETMLTMAIDMNHQYFIAITLRDLAVLTFYEGDAAGALPIIQRSLELERVFGETWGTALSLQVQGRVLLALGDQQKAGEAAAESLEFFRQLGDPWGAAGSLLVLGKVNFARNELGTGQDLVTEALETFGRLGELYGVAECLDAVGEAFQTLSPEVAASLLGRAESIRNRIGAPVPAIEAGKRTMLETALRESLGAENYEQFHAAGVDLDPKEMFAEARRNP